MRRLIACALATLVAVPPLCAQVTAQDSTLSLSSVARGNGWAVFNRRAEAHSEPARENAVYLDAHPERDLAWLPGLTIEEAVIEVDVRGQNVPGQSFMGAAFRGVDIDRYEAVYLRPFNFQADDPVARGRAIQYVAAPSHEWYRLREHHPGEYESEVPASVEPDGWVRLRVELEGPTVRVYVDGTPESVLEVDRIGAAPRGWVGRCPIGGVVLGSPRAPSTRGPVSGRLTRPPPLPSSRSQTTPPADP